MSRRAAFVRVLHDEAGLTGAEKALVLCVALGMCAAVAGSLLRGAGAAGVDGRRALVERQGGGGSLGALGLQAPRATDGPETTAAARSPVAGPPPGLLVALLTLVQPGAGLPAGGAEVPVAAPAAPGAAAPPPAPPPPPAIGDRAHWRTEALRSIGMDADGRDLRTGRKLTFAEKNRRITGAYARMYLTDPETFRWAGMAAYASRLVGRAMGQSDALRYELIDGSLALARIPNGSELLQALRIGNDAVFRDIYWQHLAYLRGGLREIEAAAARGDINADVLAGWRQIDEGRRVAAEGRRTGDRAMQRRGDDLVWRGNAALLRYEQSETLQRSVYTPSRDAFRFLSSRTNVAGLPSPIPNDRGSFRRAVPGGDVGEFRDRWRWIEESMLPAWRQRAEGHGRDVSRDMRRLADQGLPPAR